MSALRRYALRQTWSIPRHILQINCLRAFSSTKSVEWRSTFNYANPESTGDGARSAAAIPFVRMPNPDESFESSTSRQFDSDGLSTLTDRERDAFTRLFDMKDSPLIRSKRTSRYDKSVDAKKSPRERENELISLLKHAVSGTRNAMQNSLADGAPAPMSQPSLESAQELPFDADQNEPWQPEGFGPPATSQDTFLSQPEQKHTSPAELMHAGNEDILADSLAKAREEQHDRISTRLRAAQTDCALWNVLNEDVLSVILKLDLDNPRHQPNFVEEAKKKKSRKQLHREKTKALRNKGRHQREESEDVERVWTKEDRMAQLATMGPNYPSLLLIAVKLLREKFPSSILPFSILPAIKDLGRSSYVLGASTALYNELISAAYSIYCDFGTINMLLLEMETAGLEFDEQTLAILDLIRLEGNVMKRGSNERVAQQMLWGTELHQGGWRRVIAWVPVVKGGLRASAARKLEEMLDDSDDAAYRG